jgi:bifunctional non-homologous end joining protein LigD
MRWPSSTCERERLYEMKFDVYRCLAGSDSTGVTLWSWRANRFTDQFPTIAAACEHLPPDTLLDGDHGLDNKGRVSFNILHHHRSQAQAILYYAFDVIIHRGRRLIHIPLETRRELLSDMAADLKTRTPLIGLSDTLDTTPAELIPLVKEFGFEGVIAKRRDSYYESGKRSGVWLKYKVNKAQAFVIGGYTPDNPLDALIVGYYEGEKLIFVSKVRNGFVSRLRREVWAKLKHLQTDTCLLPTHQRRGEHSGALTREEMKKLYLAQASFSRADRVH